VTERPQVLIVRIAISVEPFTAIERTLPLGSVEAGQGGRLMAEDATPLVEALLAIIDAARAYLPPDGIGKDAFIARVLEATDNPRIIAALAAHGHPVAGWR
jgi:hypothetical protein